MSKTLDIDFVSAFDIAVFSLDKNLVISEVNTSFTTKFGVVTGKSIADISDDFSEKKLARKTAARQVYKCKIATADSTKTPYSVAVKFFHDSYVGFAVEASDSAKAEAMLASYSEMMEKQNKILKAEKNQARSLLNSLLPLNIADELTSLTGSAPKKFENIGVFLVTLPGLNTLPHDFCEPAIFSELDVLFTCFDLLAERYECTPLSKAGTSYLAVNNLNENSAVPQDICCERLANFALDCIALITLRALTRKMPEIALSCKIGLHIGDMMIGIIGKTQLSFTAIGPGLSHAEEAAHLCELMQVGCSPAFYQHSNLAPYIQIEPCASQASAHQEVASQKQRYILNPDFGNRDSSQLEEIILRAKTLKRSR